MMRVGIKKGQGSTEFFIILSLFATVIFTLFLLYAGQVSNFRLASDKIIVQNEAERLGWIIDYVYLSGNGSEYSTYLNNPGLNLEINGNILEVKKTGRNDTFGQVTLVTNKVVVASQNYGNIVVRNNDGVVYVS